MGPGIFTKYSKQVICGLLLVFGCIAALAAYYHFRGNVAGVSPYETVNDLYEQELLSITTEKDHYFTYEDSVVLRIRNDAEDYAIVQGEPRTDDWVLERKVDGVWRSLRTVKDQTVRWTGYNGNVHWGGGEERYVCSIAAYYKTPLEAGTYRIVLPNMEHCTSGHLAVEFTVGLE